MQFELVLPKWLSKKKPTPEQIKELGKSLEAESSEYNAIRLIVPIITLLIGGFMVFMTFDMLNQSLPLIFHSNLTISSNVSMVNASAEHTSSGSYGGSLFGIMITATIFIVPAFLAWQFFRGAGLRF